MVNAGVTALRHSDAQIKRADRDDLGETTEGGSILNEALEWLYRAEQAREVAGQLTDPGARRAVLELADIFDQLARAAASRAVLRRREVVRQNPRFHRWVARSKGGDRSEETSMARHRGSLTPEERDRVIEVQD